MSARRASWRGSWRIALRLARRDAMRSKGRTTLVALMVGIPVMLVVALATLYHTNDISPREALTSQLGQAQARIMTTGDSRAAVTQSPSAESWSTGAEGVAVGTPGDGAAAASTPSTAPSRPWTLPELERLTGGRVLPLWDGSVRLSTGTVAINVNATELPLADPQTRGMARVRSGRLPAGPGEIAVSEGLARSAGWRVGTTVHGLDTHAAVTVVGTYSTLGMSTNDRGVLATPGALHDPAGDDRSNASYLLVRDRPVSWAEVQRLNRAGLAVESRAVVLDPPPHAGLSEEQSRLSSADPATKAVLVLVIVSIVIEVVLLAGPAFAVGVRRRRRDLALLAATGSTPRDIRRSVLAEAGVIGLGSATAGAVLGLPLARIGVPVAEHFGAGVGPFDWRWRELAIALVVGGAATLLAAMAPAVQAARADVATVLAGRRGQLRSRAGWPLVGVVLVGAGAAADLTRGTRPGGELWVASGTVVIVLGAVALTPWLVGQVGRLATRLPLPLRLATRDAARQRSRTAPAVAAIMASVIGITALAIGFASDTKQGRRDYEPRTAAGVATVSIPGADAEPAVLDAVHAALPGRPVLMGEHAEPAQPTAGGSAQAVLAAPGCSLVEATGMGDPSQASDCGIAWQQVNANDSFAVYDVAALTALGVRLDSRARAVLADGGALVAAPAALRGDRALLGVVSTSDDGTRSAVTGRLSVPAAVLPPASPRTARVATVVLSRQAAQRLGLILSANQLIIGGPELTKGQEDKLSGQLTLLDASVYVERGYQQPYGLVLALLALVGSLVVVVATVTATGLAMSEARPDLATLAAVGAPPRTRRYVAAAQSVVIGLMGTALGLALGFVPGLAVTWPLTASSYSSYLPPQGGVGRPVIAIPWTMLLVVAVAVPLLAGLITGLFTRSRLPMLRRLAT